MFLKLTSAFLPSDQVAQLPLSVSDGRWHHICITWTTRDGFWEAYQDGERLGTGDNLAPWHPIKPGGVIILGQEQVRAAEGEFSLTACVLTTWAQSWRCRSEGRSGCEALLTLFPGPPWYRRVQVEPHCMFKPAGVGTLGLAEPQRRCMCSVSVASSKKLMQLAAGARLFAVFPCQSCKHCVRLLQVAQHQRRAIRQPGLKGLTLTYICIRIISGMDIKRN